jgi:hypothetical protein
VVDDLEPAVQRMRAWRVAHELPPSLTDVGVLATSPPHPDHDEGDEDGSDDREERDGQPDRAPDRPSGARPVNCNEGDRGHW